MAAGSLVMLLVAMAIFGWADVSLYLTQVLPGPWKADRWTLITLAMRHSQRCSAACF